MSAASWSGVPAEQVLEAEEDMLETVAVNVPQAHIDGVLVQELLPSGVELLVGVQGGKHGYPLVLTVGMGGTTTELYPDVVSGPGPVDAE